MERSANAPMLVRQISAEATYPLRLLVLRPGGTLADCRWPIDTADGAFHLAVDQGEGRICIASFQPIGHEAINAQHPWQLRGMATHPEHRGKGAGKLLVEHALTLLHEQNADVLWCNARLVAVPFYQRLGFEIQGSEFDVPQIGPHFLMWRRV